MCVTVALQAASVGQGSASALRVSCALLRAAARDGAIRSADTSPSRTSRSSSATSLDYLPGWTPGRFFWVYLLNYGSHVILSGGAVVSWSREFWELRQSGNRVAKFLDRLLGKVDPDHGKDSVPALWGTTPCEPRVRVAIVVAWLLVTVWIVG